MKRSTKRLICTAHVVSLVILLGFAQPVRGMQRPELLGPGTYSDRSGRVYSERQILQMGLDGLEAQWDGHDRTPLYIFDEVIRKYTAKRIRDLPGETRMQVLRL